MIAFKAFVRSKAKGSVTDATLELYDKDRQRLQGRLGPRPLNVETAQELEAWLRSRTKSANTLQRWFTSLNWLLRWKGVEYVARRPRKEVNPHPRVIEDREYVGPLERIQDAMERVAVQVSHDSGWSPCDVVEIRRAEIDLSGPRVIIRHVRRKTHVPMEAVLGAQTAAELRDYLEANPELDYIFPGDRRKGCEHRNRTWVNAVLHRHGATFSPRAFRSNLATRWPDSDIAGLRVQGGWKDTRVIFEHYKGNVLKRQISSFDAALGSKPDLDDEDRDEGHDRGSKRPRDLPGYG